MNKVSINKIPFVDLKQQYDGIKSEIDKAISKILDDTSFILGEPVKSFEAEFANFCNAKYCAGVSSGTSALFLAMKANGIGHGDEVITVPNTFIATTEAITANGASIKFVDIDPETYNLDTSKLESAITKKTKAILPVHLYGQPAEMGPIIEIAEKYDLKIIEDAAQAHGAEYNNKKIPVSSTACFSFYPGKNLGAYGDAGAVVTDDVDVFDKIMMLRNHGRKPQEKYTHTTEGSNERIDAIQAAVLKVKLKYLNDWNNKRIEHALLYSELLSDIECDSFETPVVPDHIKHVYHLYVIRVKQREKLQQYLKLKGIDTGVHYPIPVHELEAYRHLNLPKGSFPVTEKYSKEILSLPMFPELTDEQIEYVVNGIKSFE